MHRASIHAADTTKQIRETMKEADEEPIMTRLQTKAGSEDCLASVIVPRVTSTRNITALETAMQGLALDKKHPVALELAATASSRHFLLRATSAMSLRHLADQVQARYAQAMIRLVDKSDDPLERRGGETVSVVELRAGAAAYLPLRALRERELLQEGTDPLLGILGVFNHLPPHMRVVTQLALIPASPTWSGTYRRKSVEHPLEQERQRMQRDVSHRFLYREHNMRFFADGEVALCIRTHQNDGSMLDQWYGLFLLSMELDDERMMRQRLQWLLCWRESPERWSIYRHMLPVLILARSQRQRDRWRRAIEISAEKLRLDPLVGALACIPPEESAHVNPWLLNWRTHATEVSCYLQDLLCPLPREALPHSLQLGEGEEELCKAQSPSYVALDATSSGTTARLSRLIPGRLANRTAQTTQDCLEKREVVSLLGLRLTSFHWSILNLLLAHPLLSDGEVAALLGLQRRSVRCSLYELHQLGCLESIVTEVGKRWHVCERGLRLIAAANHIHIRTIADIPDDEKDMGTSTLRQRGEAWLFQHIQHTAGIYGFFADLAQTARRQSEQALCWWETGVMCERRYQAGQQWYNLRPDALAEYCVGPQQMRFWLEWDRGTMNVRDLAVKFDAYAHYIASHEWTRESPLLPVLVCVAPDIAQERRMQRVAEARLAHTSGLVLLTTTEVLFQQQGPLAPIWVRGMSQHSQVSQPEVSHRQCLIEAMSRKHCL